MRFMTILALVFALAAVPAAHAQQASERAAAVQPTDQQVQSQQAVSEADLTPTLAETAPAQQEYVESMTTRQLSAVNVLTIVGGVVVVLALIAFLR